MCGVSVSVSVSVSVRVVGGGWWWCWGGGQSSVIRGVREGRGGKDGREFSFLTAWVDEAVFQSVSPGLETPQSPP